MGAVPRKPAPPGRPTSDAAPLSGALRRSPTLALLILAVFVSVTAAVSVAVPVAVADAGPEVMTLVPEPSDVPGPADAAEADPFVPPEPVRQRQRAEDGRLVIHLATGSVGGTFLPVGHDLAAWFEEHLQDVVVRVDTTAGSVDNLQLLISGEADLAIVGTSPLRKVLGDRSRLALARDAADICVVGTLYNDAEQYVIRSSLVRAHSMLDLYGLLMYPGPHNSGGEIDTRTVLHTLQVEPRFVYPLERDKGYAEAAAALVRGEFDACTFSGGVPIAAITDLLKAHPGEYRILPFTRHQLSKVRHAELDFEQVVIPAGSYPGQTEDIKSVGGPNLLVAGPQVSLTLVSRIDAAIRDGIAKSGEGLRGDGSHAVLQILTEPLWDQLTLGARCVGGGDSARQSP